MDSSFVKSALPSDDIIWEIISRYVHSGSIEESKLKSFNNFVGNGLRAVIANASPIVFRQDNTWHVFHIRNVSVSKPVFTESDGTTHPLYPDEARVRGISYLAGVDASIHHTTYMLNEYGPTEGITIEHVESHGKRQTHHAQQGVRIMEIPVMLRSDLCHLRDGDDEYRECSADGGGYFIIGGGEKLIEYKERLAYNKPIFTTINEGSVTHMVEMRCERAGQFRSTNNVHVCMAKRTQVESEQILVENLPIVHTLRALGCESDLQIYSIFKEILGPKMCSLPFVSGIIRNCLGNHKGILDKKSAIAAIGATSGIKAKAEISKYDAGMHFLCSRFMPHAGQSQSNFPFKAWTLVDMACSLIKFVMDPSLKTDMDSYAVKRTDSIEQTMGFEYRKMWDQFGERVKKNVGIAIEKNRNISLNKVFGHERAVTSGLSDFIKRGIQSMGSTQSKSASAASSASISQKVDRSNYAAMKSQHCKILNPLSKDGKQTGPRQLHPTGAGTVCSVDSPEGESCGLIKFKAIFNDFSTHIDRSCIEEMLVKFMQVERISSISSPLLGSNQKCFVVLDGFLFGFLSRDKAPNLVRTIKEWRRRLALNPQTSVNLSPDSSRVTIRIDASRNLRPMFVLENVPLLNGSSRSLMCSWNDYLAAGVIEYIDKEEEDDLVIAASPRVITEWHANDMNVGKQCPYTHMEIHGSFIHGTSALQTPFLQHNQAPRNTYQCQMLRSAQGASSSVSKMYRTDLQHHELWYAQRPLVETKFYSLFNSHLRPAGQMLRVLLLTTGKDAQEDAQQMNIASVQRGAGRSSAYRMVTVVENNKGRECDTESIGQVDPSKCVSRMTSDYTMVDQDGIVSPGSIVSDSTVLVQKTIRIGDLPSGVTHRDLSTTMSNSENSAFVDKVLVTTNPDNMKVVKVRHRSQCYPEKGDKMSSRHGQKGTFGELPATENLPFDDKGFTVDMVINPVAFVSRMTFGHKVEALVSDLCAQNGIIGDGTPYSTRFRECLYRDAEEWIAKKRLSRAPRAPFMETGTSNETAEQKQERELERERVDTLAEIGDALEYLDLDPNGEITMRDGATGKKLHGKMFVGMTFIQKLSHMVKDKVRARGESGPVNSTTRQPTDGRKTNGGLKGGEMEIDTLSAYGAAFTEHDRMVNASDKVTSYICSECSNRAICTPDNQVFCVSCNSSETEICQVTESGTMRILAEELYAMGLNLKMHTG